MAQWQRATREVSDRLRETRVNKGLSQHDLAQAASIDRKTVNRIERYHFAPNLDTLFRLCKALDVKPTSLFKGIKP